MTPVDEMKTSRGLQPSSFAVAFAVASTIWRPWRPVKVFELPELATMARALPPGSASRHQSTGAPQVTDRVSTPATVVPASSATTMRSSRPR